MIADNADNGDNAEQHERAEPRILVVDLETAGLDARKHSILQIGAVWLTGGEGEFSMDCRRAEGTLIDTRALEVNGITPERADDPALPDEGTAVQRFLAWLGPLPCLLAGLNPSFDRAFLQEAQYRKTFPAQTVRRFPHRVLDLHSLAVTYALAKGDPVPSRGYYTDEIYAVLDLPPEPRPHQALTGARREAEALRILMGLPELISPLPALPALDPCDCVP